MPMQARPRASGLTLAIAIATVVAVVIFAVLTATPADPTTVGHGTTLDSLRVLLGGIGGVALAVVLVKVIDRVTH